MVGCWRGCLSGARCRLAYGSRIQIGFTFLVPAHPGSPGKRAVKRVCVCLSADLNAFSASDTVGWASGGASGLSELSDEVLVWLSAWSQVQIVCTWFGQCHCHLKAPASLASLKSRMFFIKVFLVPVYPGWSVILPCLTEPEVIAALWVHVVWQDFVHVSK